MRVSKPWRASTLRSSSARFSPEPCLGGWWISALARACPHRRIPSIDALEREVLALVEERNAKTIKLTWQFSLGQARDKFNRHYQRVRQEPPVC